MTVAGESGRAGGWRRGRKPHSLGAGVHGRDSGSLLSVGESLEGLRAELHLIRPPGTHRDRCFDSR